MAFKFPSGTLLIFFTLAMRAFCAEVEFAGAIGGDYGPMAFKGHYAYVREGERLTVLDIFDSNHPIVVSKTPSHGFVSIQIQDSKAYLLGLRDLTIFDITDPQSPKRLGSYVLG